MAFSLELAEDQHSLRRAKPQRPQLHELHFLSPNLKSPDNMLEIKTPKSTTFHCRQMKPGQDVNRPFILKISNPKMSDHKEGIR